MSSLREEIELVRSAYPEVIIDEASEGLVSFRISFKNGEVALDIFLPATYPSTPVRISVTARSMTRFDQDRLTTTLNDSSLAEAHKAEPEPHIFNLFQLAEAFEPSPVTKVTAPRSVPCQPLKVERRLIYSHHIIAQEKRAAISANATELNLGGFVKHGWPGLIIVEGMDTDVEEYYRRLKRFQWKHLEVRGAETDVESDECFLSRAATGRDIARVVDTLRRLSPGFDELGDGPEALGVAAIRCRENGLADLFDTLFSGRKHVEKSPSRGHDES
jgi:hypothetical protein